MPATRVESSVTSVSWIPSEAVTGPLLRGAFDAGFTHYDEPLPGEIDDLEAMRAAGMFRFANHLSTWVDVEDGRVVDAGYSGGGLMGATTVRLGSLSTTFEPVPLPDIRQEPDVSGDAARFVQTTGGRTGLPAPRRVRRPPFVQFKAPTVWTTLGLTIRADGTSDFEVVGASKFPRHWVYDDHGRLAAKVGLADFKDWYRGVFGRYTPWGDRDSKALVTAVETALERELSFCIMRKDAKPEIRRIKKGAHLVDQGDPGDELFLLLDGVLTVIVDGERVAEFGPGAILGERAVLEGGRRTSTLEARTPCRVVVARADQIDRSALEELAKGHRTPPPSRADS